jgi:hypothetical protein
MSSATTKFGTQESQAMVAYDSMNVKPIERNVEFFDMLIHGLKFISMKLNRIVAIKKGRSKPATCFNTPIKTAIATKPRMKTLPSRIREVQV